jgi:hypothetical protein
MEGMQNLPVDVKCAEWDEGGHQYFPSDAQEGPFLGYPNTQGIDHKEDEQCPMDGTQNFDKAFTVHPILQGNPHKDQNKKRHAFQKGEEPQTANAGIEVLFHTRDYEGKAVVPKVKMAKEWRSK